MGSLFGFVFRSRIKNAFETESFRRNPISRFKRSLCSSPDDVASNEDHIENVFKEISKGDPNIEKRLRIARLEMEVMRQDGRKAPHETYIKKFQWEYLSTLSTRSAKENYYGYLWKNCMATMNRKAKKAIAKEMFEELKAKKGERDEGDGHFEYSLSENSLFARIYGKTMDRLYNGKLMEAMLYGQKIVIDCSYEEFMKPPETVNAANQLTLFFASNRAHQTPADIHFCNCSNENLFLKQMRRNIPLIDKIDFPVNIHEESYMDLFPKEKLVYLTPHCRNNITFNYNDIYIIGCMVDKSAAHPHSLAKAKKDKIRMGKFPLDQYLLWNSGSGKSLTLNQTGDILLDMYLSNNWEYALKHVPQRKLVRTYQVPNLTDDSFYQKTDSSRKPFLISNVVLNKERKYPPALKSLVDEEHLYK